LKLANLAQSIYPIKLTARDGLWLAFYAHIFLPARSPSSVYFTMDTAAVLNSLRQDSKEISDQINHLLSELDMDRDTLLTWYKVN
jgi:hypothetical protein